MSARDLLAQATPRPWRKERESLDADHPETPPERWQIVAGKETRHRNKGHFHPADATYSTHEHHVVEFGYDRDYGHAEGGVGEQDAALIVAAVNEYEALLDVADTAQTVRSRIGPIRDEWDHVDELEALDEALARLDALRSGT